MSKAAQDEEDSIDLKKWRERHALRKSNAAVPHRNRKTYTRKIKHANQED